MKLTALVLFLSIALHGLAQNQRYTDAMKKNLAMFDSAKTTEQHRALAASFERIGDAEKTEWLPYYYAGLALLTPGWMDPNVDKDSNAEKVKAMCDKAELLIKEPADKSEVLALRNLAATQQMLVDPQSRWPTYGQEAAGFLKEAQQLNPSNPRLVYLEGAAIFGTPEQFGGGKTKAKPILQKAVELYKAESPKPLHPNWGKQQAEEMLAQCQ